MSRSALPRIKMPKVSLCTTTNHHSSSFQRLFRYLLLKWVRLWSTSYEVWRVSRQSVRTLLCDHWLLKTRRTVAYPHLFFSKDHSGRLRRAPLIKEAVREWEHTADTHKAQSLRRKSPKRCYTARVGEHEQQWTTLTCSSPLVNTQSASNAPRSSPFLYF